MIEWWNYLLKNRKAYLVGIALLLVWAVTVWTTGQVFGEQKSFYFDWDAFFQWTIAFVTVYSTNFLYKQFKGEEKFLSNPWNTGLSTFFGCLLTGVIIGIYYHVILPIFGKSVVINLTFYDIVLPHYITQVVTYAFFGVFAAIFFMQSQVLKYRNYLERKLANAEHENLKQANKISSLNALQANVNPHFLYNSLNSIASLIRVKSPKAEDMVIALSKLFRYHILPNQASFASVKREIEILTTYLEIEKIRFGDQLNYSIEVEPNCESVQIPRLLLQPLVENAIKHGTSKLEKGEIRIVVGKDQDTLKLEVYDNGAGFGELTNTGTGLTTVIKMLQLHYPDNHTFELTPKPDKRVLILIPINP